MTATDARAGGLPEVSISEDGPVRHLHLGTPWVQGSMNLRQPYALELEYVQRMMGWMLLAPDLDDAVQGHAMQLGLGAGALTKFCCKQVGMCTTAIELNPQVLAVCRHWFRLPEDGPTLRVVPPRKSAAKSGWARWTRCKSICMTTKPPPPCWTALRSMPTAAACSPPTA